MPCCLGCCYVLDSVWRWLTCACSASQQLAPCRVADRAALVIDIFSQAAKTKEGQLQVHACSALLLGWAAGYTLHKHSGHQWFCGMCAPGAPGAARLPAAQADAHVDALCAHLLHCTCYFPSWLKAVNEEYNHSIQELSACEERRSGKAGRWKDARHGRKTDRSRQAAVAPADGAASAAD